MKINHVFLSDILVVGGGLSSLIYLLELSRLSPQSQITLVTKTHLAQSNSYYAQGGIAAAYAQEDSPNDHLQDTLQAGAYLGDALAASEIVNAGQACIELLQHYGVQFDRQADGQLQRAQEAGHRLRRIYHCGDHTGKVMIETLMAKLRSQENIQILEEHTAIDLQVLSSTSGKEVVGAYVLENESGVVKTLFAKVVVLATGGAGKVYRYTSNPDIATGDGVAMAHRAGANVKHMEFYQFHPTLLYHPHVNNFLISEALRGEGAYLRSVDNKERFMQAYAPEAMELATRDIVARAIFEEIEQSAYDYVYLDIRHRGREFLQQRFPAIYQKLHALGFDLSQDLIPIIPGAHYMCGGVATNVHGASALPRLYVIGETAYTGLHGANRLASNSLLEAVVMGKNAAQHSVKWLSRALKVDMKPYHESLNAMMSKRQHIQIHAHWRSLRNEMSAYAGIARTQAGLEDALHLLNLRADILEKYFKNHMLTRDLIELRNMVLVAKLIVESALYRHESRGCHYREDQSKSEVNL